MVRSAEIASRTMRRSLDGASRSLVNRDAASRLLGHEGFEIYSRRTSLGRRFVGVQNGADNGARLTQPHGHRFGGLIERSRPAAESMRRAPTASRARSSCIKTSSSSRSRRSASVCARRRLRTLRTQIERGGEPLESRLQAGAAVVMTQRSVPASRTFGASCPRFTVNSRAPGQRTSEINAYARKFTSCYDPAARRGNALTGLPICY